MKTMSDISFCYVEIVPDTVNVSFYDLESNQYLCGMWLWNRKGRIFNVLWAEPQNDVKLFTMKILPHVTIDDLIGCSMWGVSDRLKERRDSVIMVETDLDHNMDFENVL